MNEIESVSNEGLEYKAAVWDIDKTLVRGHKRRFSLAQTFSKTGELWNRAIDELKAHPSDVSEKGALSELRRKFRVASILLADVGTLRAIRPEAVSVMRKLKELVPLCVVNTARSERQSAITIEHLKEEGLFGVGDQPSVVDGVYFRQPDLSENEAKLSAILRVLHQLEELGKPGSKIVVIDNDYHKCLVQAGWDWTKNDYKSGQGLPNFKDRVLVYHVPTAKEKML